MVNVWYRFTIGYLDIRSDSVSYCIGGLDEGYFAAPRMRKLTFSNCRMGAMAQERSARILLFILCSTGIFVPVCHLLEEL